MLSRIALLVLEWKMRCMVWALIPRRAPWFFVGHVGIAFMPWMKLPGIRQYGAIRVGYFGPLVVSWGR